MEIVSRVNKEEEELDLPAGFRFHPTDEELITHYLYRKVINSGFTSIAIGDVDLNKSEPWDLPWKAKMGEKEWYFFCLRDRKYPTGSRTNRATVAGYWKATGKDKEIYRGKTLVGMKKTLVFYKGRAPKGDKSNWVSHEYRLEGSYSLNNLPKSAKSEWVICRIFQKSPGGKKIHISGLVKDNPFGNDMITSNVLSLTTNTSSPYINKPRPDPVRVPCFSNQIYTQQDMFGYFTNQVSSVDNFHGTQISNPNPNSMFYTSQTLPSSNLQFPGSLYMPEQRIVSVSQETGASGGDINTEISSVVSNLETGKRRFGDPNVPSTSGGTTEDLEFIWNY